MLSFAEYAVKTGWNSETLDRFRISEGITKAEAKALWPKGIRTLGRALNDDADARMIDDLRLRSATDLNEIILRRFDQNAALKPAVARLAASDLFHPLDTLTRTATTARHMLAACGGSEDAVRRWRLVLAYCIAVLAWLADSSTDQLWTRRIVRLALSSVGLR